MIYVIYFEPNYIFIDWAYQNDCQNLSFVKANYVIVKKWPEMIVQWSTPSIVRFISDQSLGIENQLKYRI